MARTPDPRRRAELLDAIVAYLAEHGLSGLSMRPLAEHLGKSTRVLTHHFADKEELVGAALERLDELHRARMRALPGWSDTRRDITEVVRAAWDYQLAEENLPFTRLVHEIEGLAAGGRLRGHVSRLIADRVEFVAEYFGTRGVPPDQARLYATFMNATYAGLQSDVLNTGDRARAEAALDDLCALVSSWI